jgi:hypothetical protein
MPGIGKPHFGLLIKIIKSDRSGLYYLTMGFLMASLKENLFAIAKAIFILALYFGVILSLLLFAVSDGFF